MKTITSKSNWSDIIEAAQEANTADSGDVRTQQGGLTMKTKRIINAVIWVAICIVLCTMAVIEWHAQGCKVSSIIAGIAMCATFSTAIGFGIDQTIQGK